MGGQLHEDESSEDDGDDASEEDGPGHCDVWLEVGEEEYGNREQDGNPDRSPHRIIKSQEFILGLGATPGKDVVSELLVLWHADESDACCVVSWLHWSR